MARVASPRPYIEAFPRLDVGEMARQRERGLSVCFWTDESGALLGYVEITGADVSKIDFQYAFDESANVRAVTGTYSCSIIRRPLENGQHKISTTCCGCETIRERLIFVRGSWKCRLCHDLTHLSSRLSPEQKFLRQERELAEYLSAPLMRYERKAKRKSASAYYRQLVRENRARGLDEFPPQLRFRANPTWTRDISAVPEREPEHASGLTSEPMWNGFIKLVEEEMAARNQRLRER